MKSLKINCLMAVMILLVAWTGISFVFASDNSYNQNQYIKVGLLYGSNAVSAIDITSSGDTQVIQINNSSDIASNVIISDISANNLRLYILNGQVIIMNRANGTDLGILGYNQIICPKDQENDYFEVNGSRYRGGITVTQNTNGTMNVINFVDSDYYTQGVLNAELNHTNPLEALKAQAVTARSFAVAAKAYGGRHSLYDFDVCSSTHCQVYRGMTGETEKTNQAARETSHLSLYYDDKVIDAYYHKNSGGYTQDISDVWGSNVPYLKAVKDNYSPEYFWEKTYTFEQVEKELLDANKSVGTLQKIEITEKNENGYVGEISFYGTDGVVSFSGEAIRSLFGFSNIKSMNFAFSGRVERDNREIIKGNTNLETIYVLGNNGSSLLIEQPFVIGSKGETVMPDNDFYAMKTGKDNVLDYGMNIHNMIKIPALNQERVEVIESGTAKIVGNTVETSGIVTFTGLGYGHGIGMPQDSAVEMAKQGFTFMDILMYYYTGVTIQ